MGGRQQVRASVFPCRRVVFPPRPRPSLPVSPPPPRPRRRQEVRPRRSAPPAASAGSPSQITPPTVPYSRKSKHNQTGNVCCVWNLPDARCSDAEQRRGWRLTNESRAAAWNQPIVSTRLLWDPHAQAAHSWDGSQEVPHPGLYLLSRKTPLFRNNSCPR